MKLTMVIAALFIGVEASRFSPTDALADAPPAPATQPTDTAADERASDYLRHLQEVCTEEVVALDAKISHLEMSIPAGTPLTEASPEVLNREAEKVDDDSLSIELQYDAANARVAAITQQIDAMQKKAAKALGDAPVLAEMQKIVDIRQSEVDRDTKMVDAATLSRSGLDQAAAALAEAKAQLFLERDRIAAASGGDTIAALQKELADATIDEEALTAQKHRLEEVRTALIPAVKECHELWELRAEADQKRALLLQLEDKLDQLNVQEEMKSH